MGVCLLPAEPAMSSQGGVPRRCLPQPPSGLCSVPYSARQLLVPFSLPSERCVCAPPTMPCPVVQISPTALRGTLGSINQLMICVGILAALLVNVALPAAQWRLMFGLSAIPAALLGVGELAGLHLASVPGACNAGRCVASHIAVNATLLPFRGAASQAFLPACSSLCRHACISRVACLAGAQGAAPRGDQRC